MKSLLFKLKCAFEKNQLIELVIAMWITWFCLMWVTIPLVVESPNIWTKTAYVIGLVLMFFIPKDMYGHNKGENNGK